MIKVFTPNGQMYEFDDSYEAATWMNHNPALYDHDKSSLLIVSDKKFSGLLEIEELSDDHHECIVQCDGCASLLKFRRKQNEKHLRIHCPSCKGTTLLDI